MTLLNFKLLGGHFHVGVKFDLRDVWMGVFWDTDWTYFGDIWKVYVCLIPCVPISMTVKPVQR